MHEEKVIDIVIGTKYGRLAIRPNCLDAAV